MPATVLLNNNLRQVVHTHVHLQVAVAFWKLCWPWCKMNQVQITPRWLCLSWQPVRYTAFGTCCSPLLQCLDWLILAPSVRW